MAQRISAKILALAARNSWPTVKDIYVMALSSGWQRALCREANGHVQIRTAPAPRAPRDWIEAELGGANMGDRRLTARLLAMTGRFYDKPTEWRALTTFVSKTKTPPDRPPSLNEAVRLLGKLGGHPGRSGDGHPGAEVLWRGMARLADIELAYDLYH